MEKIIKVKKKISLLLLGLLLTGNSVMWATIYLLKIKALPIADKNTELKSGANLSTIQDPANICPAENIKSENDDTLFIGCNGFF